MITSEQLKAVASRASVLARRYYFLEKEDLMQEGYILLMDLDKKDLTDLQKKKAINNMFSNIERHAQYQQKIERNSSSFEVEPDIVYEQEDAEAILIREQVTEYLLNRLSHQEAVIIEWLSQGWTLDQIAEMMGIGRDRVRRLINHILEVRKELENR